MIIYRSFICFFLVILLQPEAKAQNFGGGFYLGMSGSQINGDGLGGYDLAGVNFGFLTNRKIGDRSKIQLEIAFIQKGSREVPSDTSNFYKVRLNYIEVPLLYSYRWGEFSFEIGPALDVLVTSREEQQSFEFESDPPFRTLNLTGIAGITWHFSKKLAIDFRTNNSITPIRNGSAPLGGSPTQLRIGGFGQRNVVLTFSFVYNFMAD